MVEQRAPHTVTWPPYFSRVHSAFECLEAEGPVWWVERPAPDSALRRKHRRVCNASPRYSLEGCDKACSGAGIRRGEREPPAWCRCGRSGSSRARRTMPAS